MERQSEYECMGINTGSVLESRVEQQIVVSIDRDRGEIHLYGLTTSVGYVFHEI